MSRTSSTITHEVGGMALAALLSLGATTAHAQGDGGETASERHRTGGHFTRADFARTSAPTALEFLIRMHPGLRAGNGISLSREVVWRGNSSRSTAQARRICAVSYFIDGVQVTNANDVDPALLGPVATLSLDAVEDIRVYRGPSEVPARLARPNVRCGAIAIRTRAH